MLETVVTVIHVVVALALIGLVLIQHGKGATVGASFGGSSQTMFGPRGPFAFLAKATTFIAIGFMVSSITLSTFSSEKQSSSLIPVPEAAETTESTELPTTLPERSAVPDSSGPLTDGAPAKTNDSSGPIDLPSDSK